jgi:pyridoxamine 5'-phosphate oxidase family protein
MIFTDAELQFLRSQPLGRLATQAPDGSLQNNPVGFQVDAAAGTIDIGGFSMGATRKFRNVAAHGEVAFVIDELVSFNPWTVRGVEIRGSAQALTGQDPPRPGMSGEIIRIHPRRVINWGLDPAAPGMQARTVS